MLTQDEIATIQALKRKGYSQAKIAARLKISRSTVARHWGERKLVLGDLFLQGSCPSCGTVYPQPKFLPGWKCPFCRKEYSWGTPWFNPP